MHNPTKNVFLRKVDLKFWVGSGFWGLGVGEWYGGWVRGVGEGLGIFREISGKFLVNFGKIFDKISGDPKTGNWSCEPKNQNFYKRLAEK